MIIGCWNFGIIWNLGIVIWDFSAVSGKVDHFFRISWSLLWRDPTVHFFEVDFSFYIAYVSEIAGILYKRRKKWSEQKFPFS